LKAGWWFNPGKEQYYTAEHDKGGHPYRDFLDTEGVTAISEALSEAHAFFKQFENARHQSELGEYGVERVLVATMYAEIKIDSALAGRWA